MYMHFKLTRIDLSSQQITSVVMYLSMCGILWYTLGYMYTWCMCVCVIMLTLTDAYLNLDLIGGTPPTLSNSL